MSRTQRAFDLIGAIAGLVVFAGPMLLIAAAILLDDGRPVLFGITNDREVVEVTEPPILLSLIRAARGAASRR